MTIRTIALSFALAVAALAAPPAASTALACGGYSSSPEMIFSRAATDLVATRWGVTRDKVQVLDVELGDGETAMVDVRILNGEKSAFRRRYVVAYTQHGFRVKPTAVAYVERLTKDGWARA
jgi:hypothetical protein